MKFAASFCRAFNILLEVLISEESSLTQGIKDATESLAEEDRLRQTVEGVRLEVQAMGAAIAEFALQGHAAAASPLKGTEQPGNKFNRVLLLAAFSKQHEGSRVPA